MMELGLKQVFNDAVNFFDRVVDGGSLCHKPANVIGGGDKYLCFVVRQHVYAQLQGHPKTRNGLP